MYAATVRLKDGRSIDYDIACDTEAFARREIISQMQQDSTSPSGRPAT